MISQLLRRGFAVFVATGILLGGDSRAFAKEEPSAHVRTLRNEFAKVDPVADGWKTEKVSEAIGEQLKELGKLIEKGGHRAWFGGRDDAVAAADLRMQPLAEVYAHEAMTVRRPSSLKAEPARSFKKAFDAFLAPIILYPKKRAHFKVFRITNDDMALAEVLVTTFAKDEDSGESIQQNARWRTKWTIRPGVAPELALVIPLSYEEIEQRTGKGTLFSDCTESVLGKVDSYEKLLRPGLDHWAKELDQNLGVEAVGYQGISLGDANGDGLDDLYISHPGGVPNQLFLQKSDGTMRDVSSSSGTDFLDRGRSALFVDFDNDGDQDLAILLQTWLVVMENDGTGVFAIRKRIELSGTPFSAAAADYDNDGDVDLYICNYGDLWGGFGDLEERFPIPYHDANNGGPNALLRNDGDWTFSDVTRETGIGVNNRRWSLAAAWEDYDNDGDQDLYVANDFGRNNLYRNDGESGGWVFTDIAEVAGVVDISPGMSVTWGDYDRDGAPDIYVSNMFSGAGNRITYQEEFQQSASAEVRGHYQRFARGNTLFQNAGDGRFRDKSIAMGVTQGRWAWASRFADINNDGYEDLVVANGFLTQTDPGDL